MKPLATVALCSTLMAKAKTNELPELFLLIQAATTGVFDESDEAATKDVHLRATEFVPGTT